MRFSKIIEEVLDEVLPKENDRPAILSQPEEFVASQMDVYVMAKPWKSVEKKTAGVR